MSDVVDKTKKDGINKKGWATILFYMVFMLSMAIFMPYMFKNLDKGLDENRMNMYERTIIEIKDWEDSPEKADYIAYTNKVIAEEDPTYPQKYAVEAKYNLLKAVQKGSSNKVSVNTDQYEDYIIDAKELPESPERDIFIKTTTDLIADKQLSEIDEARIEAEYETLYANQEYREVNIKTKIKEWWQSK